jgi:hypothetical protein
MVKPPELQSFFCVSKNDEEYILELAFMQNIIFIETDSQNCCLLLRPLNHFYAHQHSLTHFQ